MEKINIECEKCKTVVAVRKVGGFSYSGIMDGATQTGNSKKDPGGLATFCPKHSN